MKPRTYEPGDRVVVEGVVVNDDRYSGTVRRATGEVEDYGDGHSVAMYEVLLDGMDAAGEGIYVPANRLTPEVTT